MKRQDNSGAERGRRKPPRTTQRVAARSPKTTEIVGLVEAISADLGSRNGVHLGKGIARLLTEVYGQRRGTIPAWVRQLVTHYSKSSDS